MLVASTIYWFSFFFLWKKYMIYLKITSFLCLLQNCLLLAELFHLIIRFFLPLSHLCLCKIKRTSAIHIFFISTKKVLITINLSSYFFYLQFETNKGWDEGLPMRCTFAATLVGLFCTMLVCDLYLSNRPSAYDVLMRLYEKKAVSVGLI